MKHNEFEIGKTFFASAGFQWLCTDKGTRTITAIMLDPDKKEYWFKGPPYSVEEEVFDEHEMLKCTLNYHDLLEDTEEESYHPNFSNDDVNIMMKSRMTLMGRHTKLLSRDRVATNGDILHPYSIVFKNEQKFVQLLEIFSRQYLDMLADDFVQLPFIDALSMKKRHDEFNQK